jgi:hypothetical protein
MLADGQSTGSTPLLGTSEKAGSFYFPFLFQISIRQKEVSSFWQSDCNSQTNSFNGSSVSTPQSGYGLQISRPRNDLTFSGGLNAPGAAH